MKKIPIKSVPIEKLKLATYNPREISADALTALGASIDEFGSVQPIVWNCKTGNVVGGHQRLKVLIARGEKSVECSVVSLSLEKEKALNIALNSPQLQGHFTAGLDQLIADLRVELPDLSASLHMDALASISDPITTAPFEHLDQVEGKDDPPESVAQNLADLQAIQKQRREGNAEVANDRDTERYVVLVCRDRRHREEILCGLGLPIDERYVPAESVTITPRGKVQPVGVKVSDAKHSGACG